MTTAPRNAHAPLMEAAVEPCPTCDRGRGGETTANEGHEVLRAIVDRISSGSDMDSVLGDVIALCSNLTACRGALIYLWDESQEELVVRAATPEFQFAVGVVRLRLGQGLTGWSAMTRQPGVISDHPSQDSRFLSVSELDDDSFQSCLTVPLIARGDRLIGVITLHSDATGAFEPETVELMGTISSLVADAVHLVQLDRQVLEREASLNHLADAAGVHEAGIPTPHRLYRLARGARDLLHADLGAIAYFDTERTTLRLATWCSDDPVSMEHHPVPLSAEWSRFLHGPAAAYRITEASPLRALVTGGETFTTCFVCSIVMSGEPIGLVCCFLKSGRGLCEAETRDLTTLARLAAPIVADLQADRGHRGSRSAQGLFELLRAGDTEGALVRQLVRELGLRTTEPHVVLECVGSASAEPSSVFERLEDGLLEIFPTTLVDAGPNVLTALVPVRTRSGEETLARIVQKAVGKAGSVQVGTGCSEPARVLSDYPDRLQQATVAATVSQAARSGGTMVRYRDLGAERFLWLVARQPDLGHRAAPIQSLVEYDQERGTELLRTLDTYLSFGANVNRTAAELFLHRNTLRQRLDRITQLTNLTLDDPTSWFDVMLAIRLHRLHEAMT